MSLNMLNNSQILDALNFTGHEMVQKGSVNLTAVAQKCFETCKDWQINANYEFVWLFIISFFFSQSTSFILGNKHLNAAQQRSIIMGMKIASFMFNLIGIFWFLLTISR